MRVLVYCAFASNHWDDSCAAGRYLAGLGPSHGFEVDLADQLGDFANKDLASYDAVVFAGTLRDVLTSTEESQLQQYVEAGGSFVGLYQAANTETQWPFYVNELLSGAAATKGHCHDGAADVTVQAAEHPALAGVPRSFRTHAKGWYAFDRPPSGVTVLMTASGPTTAKGFEMVDSPIAFARTGSFGGRIAFSMLAPPQDVVELDWFSRHFAALIVWAASG